MAEKTFDGLSKKFKVLKDLKDPSGNPLKVKPHLKDAELFVILKRDMDEADAKRISAIMINMIKRTYPGENEEDIKAYVAMHYGELLKELAELYGFSTKENIEKLQKKLASQ